MDKQEIIEKLKAFYGFRSDNELAEFLGVGRQGIYQFKNGKRPEDINTAIITKLFETLESRN